MLDIIAGDKLKGKNIIPFFRNCSLPPDRKNEEDRIKNNLGICKSSGTCVALMKLSDEWKNVPSATEYLSYKDNGEDKSAINMMSMLFCKHGGLITPVCSGQRPWTITGISKEGLRALMELEILNEYSEGKGFLVIVDGKLIGIKPHLAGDGYVTVGFGDCLQGDDLDYYTNHPNFNGYLSDKTSEYSQSKNTVIPVDVCLEKLLKDIKPIYEDVKEQFGGMSLSQNQIDAIIIAKYQCYKLGVDSYNSIVNGATREELYENFLKAHGKNGDFESRTSVEMNIYFDSNYAVEGGKSSIIVEGL